MARGNPGNEVLQGEEAIIELLAPLTQGHPEAFALRDDCALLTPEPDTELVLKTDPIVEGIHFLASDTPQDIGWKALAVNVSDLAAKTARPVGYLMALSFPTAPTRTWMGAFVDGLEEAQRTFGCRLLGGDTDRRPGPLTISVTAVGSVPRGGMIPRRGAQPGDVLFVSGTIGDASLGLRLATQAKLQALWGLRDAEVDWLRQRYCRPQPRLALGQALRQYASAAMDISDGLVKDLERMLRVSGHAGRLVAPSVPLSGAARRIVERTPEVLSELITAGDDYEILAAVPNAKALDFAGAASQAGVTVTRVGEVLPGHAALSVIGNGGVPFALPHGRGWDHF